MNSEKQSEQREASLVLWWKIVLCGKVKSTRLLLAIVDWTRSVGDLFRGSESQP